MPAPPDQPSQEDAQARPSRPAFGLTSTRRAVVLALVVSALALSVAVPLRNYLTQRSELAEVQQQQERLREQVDGLEDRKADLSDPAQIEAEARRRLRYVRPGETPYNVPVPTQIQQPPDDAPQPWYNDLWDSANADPAGPSDDGGSP